MSIVNSVARLMTVALWLVKL